MSELQFHTQVLGMLADVQTELKELSAQLRRNAKPLLTIAEVAELTGRAPYTVRRWVKEGLIRAERVEAMGPRSRMLVPRSEILKLLDQGKAEGVPPSAMVV